MDTCVTTAETLALATAAPIHGPLAAVCRKEAAARTASSARSNILGITGLPRFALAAMFRRDGLFGGDSELTANEQATVQGALPAIPVLKQYAAGSPIGLHHAALADYVRALAAGRPAVEERARLQAAGLSSAAIDEAAIIVENVRIVFQPVLETTGAARPLVVAV